MPEGSRRSLAHANHDSDVKMALLSVHIVPTTLRVVPGKTATLSVDVVNLASVVDRFSCQVVGIPADWWSVTPDSLELFPETNGRAASGGPTSGRFTVTIHPPRSPDALAREWPIGAMVTSEHTGQRQVEEATLNVEGFGAVTASLSPAVSNARRQGQHVLRLSNFGNKPDVVGLEAKDPEDLLEVTFRKSSIQLGAGESGAVSLGVKSREGNFVGSVRSRPFSVEIRPSSDAPPITLSATFRHHPIIPSSAPTAVAVLLALAIGGFGVLNLAGVRNMIPSASTAPSFPQVALEPSAPPSVAPAAPSTAAPQSASPTANPTPTPKRTKVSPTPTPPLMNRFSANWTGTLPPIDAPLQSGSYILWFRIDLPEGAFTCSQRLELISPTGTLKDWIDRSVQAGTDPYYARLTPPRPLSAGVYKFWARRGDCKWEFLMTEAVTSTPTPPPPTPPPTAPPAPS
jgi:hypothetical protein